VTPREQDALTALLQHLDGDAAHGPHAWREWQVTPVTGGANNLLYRATSARADYAIKFTVRDARDRAGREYAALSALHQAGLPIVPLPIHLDQERYRQPVVVQSWLEGDALKASPENDADWDALLAHYCAIHTLTPSRAQMPIAEATVNMSSAAAGRLLVAQHVAKLPPEALPASLLALLGWLEKTRLPEWDAPPRALCHTDPNWRNFIRRPRDWASVDWENSGWGDPAFEIADLITHPAYEHVGSERWEWLAAAYAERRHDPCAVTRIHTYVTILLIWWVVRMARYLYEVPRGLDPRLATRPQNWQRETERKCAQYVERAEGRISALR
jgi:aminoglycoside phosphotransferase (APT) family kinase protein